MLSWMYWTVPSAVGFGLLFSLLIVLGVLDSYRPGYPRKGFLPIVSTRGDRVFISFLCFFILLFAWLKFLPDVTPWGAVAISLILAAVILKWG
jgi:predicted small integral membrane protein